MKSNRFINHVQATDTHTAIGATEQSAAVPTSFEARQDREHDRKFIRGYRDSYLGNRYSARGSVKVAPRQNQPPKPITPDRNTRQAFNSPGGHHFSEPTGRSYNPYE